MLASMLANITSPYSSLEAFFYDALVAPAVASMAPTLATDLVASLPKGGDVLEVGSGGGQLALHLASLRSDLRITGLDLSRDQVARAKRRNERAGDRVQFVVGSALDLPFESDEFDATLSVASIKHWPDPRQGLRECVRVLRPGGALFVVEADRGCRYDDAREFVKKWRVLPGLTPVALAFFRTLIAGRAFDLDDTRALARDLPIEDLRVERISGTPALMLRGIKRR